MATDRVPGNGLPGDDHTPVLHVHAVWRQGPRTRAWDDLWRWLLADDDARKQPEDESVGRPAGDS